MPQEVKDHLTFMFVERMDEVLALALAPRLHGIADQPPIADVTPRGAQQPTASN